MPSTQTPTAPLRHLTSYTAPAPLPGQLARMRRSSAVLREAALWHRGCQGQRLPQRSTGTANAEAYVAQKGGAAWHLGGSRLGQQGKGIAATTRVSGSWRTARALLGLDGAERSAPQPDVTLAGSHLPALPYSCPLAFIAPQAKGGGRAPLFGSQASHNGVEVFDSTGHAPHTPTKVKPRQSTASHSSLLAVQLPPGAEYS